MSKRLQITALLGLALLGAAAVSAQYPSRVVDFNQSPIGDLANSQDMIRIPQLSPSTSAYIVANTSGYNNNDAYRAAGLQTEGAGALEIFFKWVNPADANSWVRLTTNAAPVLPNPALDLHGKVRFKLTNRSEFFAGSIGVCLGIRETGVDVAQLADGGVTGTIEWVGTNTTHNAIKAGANGIVNTTATGGDIQVYPVGENILDPNRPGGALPADSAVIIPGGDGVLHSTPAGDDQYSAGFFYVGTSRVPVPAIQLPPSASAYALEWNLATGQVTVDGVPQSGGIAPFTGDGVLSAANNRGVLEHIAVTLIANDGATNIDFAIDELQFESTTPDPTPAPSIVGPVNDSQTSVQVNCLANATLAELFLNDASMGTQIPSAGLATFSGLTLHQGDKLQATQTANALVSPKSTPVYVYRAGTALADGFDGYSSQAALEQVWTSDTPAATSKIRLTQGSASSCDNFIVQDYVSAATGAMNRLYYNLGAVNGTDTQPLWVTYRFKNTTNNTNARERVELTSSLSRATGAVGFAMSNGVANTAFGTQYTSLVGDNTGLSGYLGDYFGYAYALTGVPRTANIWHKMQIEVRSSVVNFYVDGVLANPRDPNDPNVALYPAGVPRPNSNPYQYLVVGLNNSNNGGAMDYDDFSVTFGNTTLPFGNPNPTASPTLTGTLYPTATTVNVGGLDPNNATLAKVYVNGALAGSASGPFATGTAAVTVPALTNGATVAATQTIAATESCKCAAATVAVPVPALPQILVPGQTTISVSNIVPNVATAVKIYVDNAGTLTLLATLNNPTTNPAVVPVAALVLGQLITATQVIGGIESAAATEVKVSVPGALYGWTQTTSLPVGLTGHALAYLNGYIYCVGGRSDASAQAVNTVYFAKVNDNGSLSAWQATTVLPGARAVCGAAGYNGRLYCWGGWDNNGFITQGTSWYATQNADGTIGAWTTSAAVLPVLGGQQTMDAFGRGTLSFKDTLYVINGENNGAVNQSACLYSKVTSGDYGAWTSTTATDNASWFHGVAIIEGAAKNYLYRVAGNLRGTNETFVYRNEILADGSLGAWSVEATALPSGRYEFGCAQADYKYIFAVAGLNGSTPQNTVYYAQADPNTGAVGTWVASPAVYPKTLSRNAAIAYAAGGHWYLLGVAGGPYSGATRSAECYYALVNTDYHDLNSLAQLQRCYDPVNPASAGCAATYDQNKDGFVNFTDYQRIALKIAGPN